MKMSLSHKLLSGLALILSTTLLFTSCSGLNNSGNKEDETAKEIREVVETFFLKLQDANMDKAYRYMTDDFDLPPIEDFEVERQDMYTAFLEKMEFVVEKPEGDKDDEEGSCSVTLTVVDMEAILDDLEDGYLPEDMIDAISDKKAPTTEDSFDIECIYDDDWYISDAEDAIDFLFSALNEISFLPESNPVLDEYFATLASTNWSALSTMGVYTEDSFIDAEYLVSQDIAAAMMSNFTYEIVSTEETGGDTIFTLNATYPNYLQAMTDYISNDEILSNLVREFLLEANECNSLTDAETVVFVDGVYLYIISNLTADYMTTSEVVVTVANENNYVKDIQGLTFFTDIYNDFYPLDYTNSNTLIATVEDTLEELHNDGTFSDVDYMNLLTQLGLQGGGEPVDATWMEIEPRIQFEGFYNYETGLYDNNGNNPYESDTCSKIEYSFEFTVNFNISVAYTLKDANDEVIYSGIATTYQYPDSNLFYLDCTCECEEGTYEPGEYTIVISLEENGEIIRMETTTVY